ncbi:MAG TPA: two-component system response regulator [Gammaproteobacteria bacterium]|nr:two-component system response regulator [Gammaproteobacteria bacterium]
MRTPAKLLPADLLIVEDDARFAEVLAAAMVRRGFQVTVAGGVAAARTLLDQGFSHALVDLSLPDGSGLELVAALAEADPPTRVVVMTGYASIATAVEAIKLGAVHYLTKPTDADELLAAFERADGRSDIPLPDTPPSVERLQWEHIQRVLTECGGNVSEAARRLAMHRRTLQRRLRKHPVRR